MPDQLLSVSAAAARLGVHVETVRRWTDAGKLPEVRTPGGHRRIPAAAVERLLAEGRAAEAPGAPPDAPLPEAGGLAEQAWAEHAVVHTRFGLRAHGDADWRQALTDDDRAQNRESGRRLMGLLLQHVADDGDEAARWAEVRTLARAYADQMRARGLSRSEALRATLFFRDAVTESTAYYPHGPGPAADPAVLLRRVNAFLNEVQVTISEAYDEGGA